MELSRPFVAGLVVGAAVTAVVLSQRKQNARHTPSAVLRDSALENVFAPIKRQYSVTTADLNNIVDNMISEMKKGLLSREAQLKMLPSYINRTPSGSESGSYLALDLGGSNFRTVRIVLEGNGNYTLTNKKFVIPKEAMQGSAESLFGFIADRIAEFCPETVRGAVPVPLGFTFSFPVDQHAIARGSLIKWTKGFSASGCVGKDVVDLLQTELNKRSINVRVVALVNDTVGTLLAHALKDTSCYVGLILGTGTNGAYLEDATKIRKLGSLTGHMIINTEWGAFSGPSLVPSDFDQILDAASINPGEQPFEKMISGMYLGELCRLTCLRLVEEKHLFVDLPCATLLSKDSFKTSFMSAIEEDYTPQLLVIGTILEREMDIMGSHVSDRIIVKMVVEAVATRAARLSAAGAMALVKQMGRNEVCVAIDGSLFKLYPLFAARMGAAVTEIIGSDPYNVTLTAAEDGSGVGAATAAAMADAGQQ